MKNNSKSHEISSQERKIKELSLEVDLLRDAYFQLEDAVKEKEQAQHELLGAVARYRVLVENAPVAIYYLKGNGEFVSGNRQSEELIGYSRSEFHGKTFPLLQVLAKSDLPRARKIIEENKKGKSTGPDLFELISKDGKKKVVNMYTSVFNTPEEKFFLRIIEDVTALTLARNDVDENQQKYQTAINQTGQVVYDYNTKTGKVIWLGAIKELTGCEDEECQRLSMDDWAEMIHPEDRVRAVAKFERAVKEKIPYADEYRLEQKDGSYTDVQSRGGFVLDNKGNGAS
ncbi:MAG: PAS domain-containing protein, partial [bacterium]|nr:PAS domain-containing protein [bacterium]